MHIGTRCASVIGFRTCDVSPFAPTCCLLQMTFCWETRAWTAIARLFARLTRANGEQPQCGYRQWPEAVRFVDQSWNDARRWKIIRPKSMLQPHVNGEFSLVCSVEPRLTMPRKLQSGCSTPPSWLPMSAVPAVSSHHARPLHGHRPPRA